MKNKQHAKASTSEGLRDRLFHTLDQVIDGKIKKEQVEAVCYISSEILKSARVDLDFEEASQRRLKIELELQREKNDSIKMLSTSISECGDVEDAEL